MELTEFLNSSTAGAAIAGMSAALYKAVKSLLEFNDEYLRKRRFKHYAYLSSESTDHPDVQQFINQAKKEDLFRVLFGKSVPPRVASAYMELYDSQYFSLSELRATLLYSRIDDHGEIQIEPGKGGWFTLVVMFLIVIFFGAIAATAAFALLETKELGKSAGALGILAFYISVSWVYGIDARAILVSLKAKKKLTALRQGNLTSGST
jgi:hypothetical protein